jgi:hypothetical protein
LYGLGHLDNAQYSALGWITQLLQRITRSFGRGMSPAGVWAAIVQLGLLRQGLDGINPPRAWASEPG